ncbi:MAG: cell division protein FtsL [Pseudomonadota bacterium]
MSVLPETQTAWYESPTLAIVALFAATAAAVALAFTKHESRKNFIELQRLSRERDAINIEWTRLQIEQAAYAAHTLIEEKAAGQLSLKRPESGDLLLIGDDGDYRFFVLEPAVGDDTRAVVDDETGATP